MSFETIASQMVVLFLCMLLGIVARKCGIMNDQFDSAFSKLVLDVALPCMIIAAVITSDSMPDAAAILNITFYAAVVFAVVLPIAFLVPYLFHIEPTKRGTYSFMMTFGNVGFIGFPVLNSIYGSQAILYGAIFNIPFNLLIFTVGILMLSESDGSVLDQIKQNAKSLLSPTLIACFAALVLALLDVTNTGIIGEAVHTVGEMTTPSALLIIGSSLAKVPVMTMITHFRTYIMAAFRLVIIPVAVWFVFRSFITDPMLLGVMVITSGMPVATNGTLMCMRYGGDLDTMLRGTFVTTVLSMLTIPLLATLLL